MAGPATLYQTGNHAGRPAAGSGCVLYTCTDHNLVYRDDGSSWSTFITLASGIADTTFNAKGDILSASADDTPAILSVGSNGSVLRAASGQTTGLEWQKNNLAATAAPGASDDNTAGYSVGSAWFDTTNDEVYFAIDVSTGAAVWKQVGSGGGGISSGTSFPGGPSTDDLFYHTTYDMLFYYDGTRWLCTCPHELLLVTKESVVFNGISINTSPISRTVVPWKGTLGIWLVAWDVGTIVVSTNNGSNYWTVELGSVVSAGTRTAIGSGQNTASDTVTTHNHHTESIAAVLDANAIYMDINATKTSSPGNLFTSGAPTVRFRYIGT